MLYTAFVLAVLLMHRLGLFEEYLTYRQLRELDEHVMSVADDAAWQDRMDDFRKSHPRFQDRCWMRLS